MIWHTAIATARPLAGTLILLGTWLQIAHGRNGNTGFTGVSAARGRSGGQVLPTGKALGL